MHGVADVDLRLGAVGVLQERRVRQRGLDLPDPRFEIRLLLADGVEGRILTEVLVVHRPLAVDGKLRSTGYQLLQLGFEGAQPFLCQKDLFGLFHDAPPGFGRIRRLRQSNVHRQIACGQTLLLGKGEEGANRLQLARGVGQGNAQAIGIGGYFMTAELGEFAVAAVPADEAMDFGLCSLAFFRRQAGQEQVGRVS